MSGPSPAPPLPAAAHPPWSDGQNDDEHRRRKRSGPAGTEMRVERDQLLSDTEHESADDGPAGRAEPAEHGGGGTTDAEQCATVDLDPAATGGVEEAGDRGEQAGKG